MASCGNSYEEARKKRLQENLKKIEGLGINAITESLSEVAKCKTKKHTASPMSKKSFTAFELRRSSRARNLVSSYREDESADINDVKKYFRSYNRRGCSKRAYNGTVASYEERIQAIQRAEKFENNLKSSNPSFIKPMVRSHVSSCFWLGLPTRFCKDHLPVEEVKMILEDEKGEETEVVYIGSRVGLSGGWRGFALDHGLDDGDALLFELVQTDRFKVYIFKAVGHADLDDDENPSDSEPHAASSADDLEDEDAMDHKEIQQKNSHSKGRKGRPRKKDNDRKLNGPQRAAENSAFGARDEDGPDTLKTLSKRVHAKGQAKTIANRDDGDDEKLSDRDLVTENCLLELQGTHAADVVENKPKTVRSKGRVKRPPKRSRF